MFVLCEGNSWLDEGKWGAELWEGNSVLNSAVRADDEVLEENRFFATILCVGNCSLPWPTTWRSGLMRLSTIRLCDGDSKIPWLEGSTLEFICPSTFVLWEGEFEPSGGSCTLETKTFSVFVLCEGSSKFCWSDDSAFDCDRFSSAAFGVGDCDMLLCEGTCTLIGIPWSGIGCCNSTGMSSIEIHWTESSVCETSLSSLFEIVGTCIKLWARAGSDIIVSVPSGILTMICGCPFSSVLSIKIGSSMLGSSPSVFKIIPEELSARPVVSAKGSSLLSPKFNSSLCVVLSASICSLLIGSCSDETSSVDTRSIELLTSEGRFTARGGCIVKGFIGKLVESGRPDGILDGLDMVWLRIGGILMVRLLGLGFFTDCTMAQGPCLPSGWMDPKILLTTSSPLLNDDEGCSPWR